MYATLSSVRLMPLYVVDFLCSLTSSMKSFTAKMEAGQCFIVSAVMIKNTRFIY